MFPEVPEVPCVLKIEISVLAKLEETVAPVMLPPEAAIVKSLGSMIHVPGSPFAAVVRIFV